MNRGNAAKLGLAVVAGGAILAVALFVLLGVSLWDETELYHLSIETDVHGLSEGSPVEIRGVRVGQVERIRLFPDDQPNAIRVDLSVAAEVPVYRGAHAKLKFQGVGVSGQRYIAIEAGEPARGRIPAGSRIPIQATAFEKVTDRIVQIADGAEALMTSTSTLVRGLSEIVQAVEGADVRSMVEDARRTFTTLRTSAGRVDELIAENRRVLAQTVDDAAATADRAREVFDEASSAMARIEQLVIEISTSVDASDDELRATLRNLRRATRSMASLGQRLERDPSLLLFSDAPEERELP